MAETGLNLELQVTKLETLTALAAACQEVVVTFDNVDDIVDNRPDLLEVLGTSREEIRAVFETLRGFSDRAHDARNDVSRTLKADLRELQRPSLPAAKSGQPAQAGGLRPVQTIIPVKAPPERRVLRYIGEDDDGEAGPSYTEGCIDSFSDLQEAWRAAEASGDQ